MSAQGYFGNINDHIVAMTAAIALHGGVATWAMQADSAVEMRPQVIQVSMVTPSNLAEPKADHTPDSPAPVTPPKPDGLKLQKKIAKHTPEKTEKSLQKAVSTPLTSGPQAPDATEKVAARSEPVFNAAYLHNPPPAYPAPARRSGVQGRVMLQVQVSAEGNAQSVIVAHSSGSSLLDEAALGAVKAWRFVPAKQRGEVVEAQVLVPVEFKLN